MSSKLLASLLLVLIAYQPASANEEYFKNSIFKALKEKNGQFSSEYKAFIAPNQTMLVDDKFSFKLNVHDLVAKAGNYVDRFLFVNTSEVYTINERTRDCSSESFNKTILKNCLVSLAREEVYNAELDYKVFGK